MPLIASISVVCRQRAPPGVPRVMLSTTLPRCPLLPFLCCGSSRCCPCKFHTLTGYFSASQSVLHPVLVEICVQLSMSGSPQVVAMACRQRGTCRVQWTLWLVVPRTSLALSLATSRRRQRAKRSRRVSHLPNCQTKTSITLCRNAFHLVYVANYECACSWTCQRTLTSLLALLVFKFQRVFALNNASFRPNCKVLSCILHKAKVQHILTQCFCFGLQVVMLPSL